MSEIVVQDIAELSAIEELQLRTAIYNHLTSNHYPSLPAALVEPALEAVRKVKAGEFGALVSLEGTGVAHRSYGSRVPVSVLLEDWNLGWFWDWYPSLET
jgi:hypothetical protein